MPISLANANVGKHEKIYDLVIDEMRHSVLLENMIFDNAVGPQGGSTLTYGYMRTTTHATAKARELNSEYTAQEAIRTKVNVDLSILGGAFEIDRVIANTSGAINEIEYQIKEKVKAVHDQFANLMINGAKGGADKFDGLKALLTVPGKNLVDGKDVNVTVMNQQSAESLLELVDTGIAQMDGMPTMIIVGRKMKTKLIAAARITGYHTRSEDAFGKYVDEYNGIPIVYAGEFIDTNGTTVKEVIPVAAQKTDIYLVRVSMNGLHGVSLAGDKLVNTYLPDLKLPGAVKKGEVEFPVSVALKSERAACRIKDITVEAPGA